VLFIPSCPGYTGLTGALDRSDQCEPLWDFGLTGLTGVEPLSGSCSVLPAGTGLIGGAHRSDRCGSVDSRFGFSAAFLGSVGGVLVPRSNSTPVATWA
jgi:hypothetical protein